MKNLLVALDLTQEEIEIFKSIPDVALTVKKQSEVTADDVKDKHIIVGNINPNLLESAANLEFLQLNSAGYDNYIKKISDKTVLCSSVGAFSPAVSEHMLAMTFSLIRHFHMYRDKQNNKDWSDLGKIISVENSTITVLGLGDIGKSYAKKVKAIGASCVIGVKRNISEKPEYIDELYTLDDFEKAVKKADIVVNVLPSTPQTVNLFDKNHFDMMKNGAYFINVGRGDAVDENALVQAVKDGKLSGAALDVTRQEPLDKNSPIWSEPRILLTPHVAGWFFLQETKNRIVKISSDNVRAFVTGQSMRNVVEH
ncbi:MAG: D-2-hydroxyacid dehydrogenase [Succinatimonas hippei]|nr:D-2-hydroxyacid dehydrogenase [Succinatimonas hippei]